MALVHEKWRVRIKSIDLTSVASSSREAAVKRLLTEEPKQLYDLETEPGVRATLLHLSPREHVFVLMTHHIVSDWHSVGIFWREFAAAYGSFSRGESPSLPAVTFRHVDYADLCLARAHKTGFTKELTFWEAGLRGSPEFLELPADRPRPPKPSHRGARQRLFLRPTLTRALRDVTQEAGTSQFTVFAAALNVLLYRYTGKEDILVGIPVTERDNQDLRSAFGCFINTHVLRTQLSGGLTFRKLLTRVQKQLLRLQLHRAVPFDQVVRRLQPERDTSYSPLFQVMLSWRDRDHLPSFNGLDGFVVKPDFAESGSSKFDLTLWVTDCGEEFWLEAEYNIDVFDEARIKRMLDHFQTLLESAADNPDECITKLPLLTQNEREKVLLGWNRAEADYPRERTLHELIAEQALRAPGAVAAVFGGQQLSYSELNERADRLASHLRELGVGPNTLVGVCAERSLEMVIGLVGILKAGGAYVPLDPAYPRERLAFILKDCQPPVLLTQKGLKTRLPEHRSTVVYLDTPFEDATRNEIRPSSAKGQSSDLAYVLYTSGSTGKPKGVQVSNRALVNLLTSMQREPGLRASDTLLAITTLSFDIAGLELFLPLITGARVVIANREETLDGSRLMSLMERCGATVMQATPATWRLLLDAGWKGSRRLKILCGGEAWPPILAAELLPRCDSLWNMYGPTETTIWSAVARVEADQPVLIGQPISNTFFYVLDAERELVPVGVPGELYIGGDGLAEGYLNRPDLTAERFVNNPFRPGTKLYRTGDVVRRTEDGKLEFLHRIDQQVKIRGFRIELGEIEVALAACPGVSQCAVVVREDTPGDKALVAYFELHAGTASAAGDVRAELKKMLPDYMVPSVFVAMNRLPLTPNGKLDRKVLSLRPLPVTRTEPTSTAITPRTPMECELARIWEQVLGIDVVSVRDNFFDLGGHSLRAVEVFARIENAFNVRLPLATLYDAPTIEDIARTLQAGGVSAGWKSLVPIQPSGSRPPLFCFHGAGGNVLIYRKLSQYLGQDQPFYGLQAQGLDGVSPLLTTIEAMAAHYIKEIRAVKPHGPYLLGGYCMGGSIAYEAAQQLQAAGEHVALLALFDTLNWQKVELTRGSRLSYVVQRLLFHAAAVMSLDVGSKQRFLDGKIADLWNRIPVWKGKFLSRLKRGPADGGTSAMLLAQVWKTNDDASRSYVPRRYLGLVTDFRPTRQYSMFNKPGLKWEHLAQGGQHVVNVPAYPGVMLVEPFVKDLARALEDSINTVISDQPDAPDPKGIRGVMQSENLALVERQ